MANTFKSLLPSDYSITPFPAYYDYSYTYTSGSVNSEDVQLFYGSRFPSESGQLRTANAEYDLYNSVLQCFYSPIPKAQSGITSASYTPSESVWVISITQDVFGNTIVPGTLSVVVDSTSSYDDGKGNLFVSNSIVGHIFYDKGIVAIQPTQSISNALNSGGMRIVESGELQVNFTSSLNLHEHSIRLKIAPDEFLYALNNPTVQESAVSGGLSPINMMHKRTMVPYVTTIGLYNSYNELLAVAKVSNPIQRTTDITQTFVVKFDT